MTFLSLSCRWKWAFHTHFSFVFESHRVLAYQSEESQGEPEWDSQLIEDHSMKIVSFSHLPLPPIFSHIIGYMQCSKCIRYFLHTPIISSFTLLPLASLSFQLKKRAKDGKRERDFESHPVRFNYCVGRPHAFYYDFSSFMVLHILCCFFSASSSSCCCVLFCFEVVHMCRRRGARPLAWQQHWNNHIQIAIAQRQHYWRSSLSLTISLAYTLWPRPLPPSQHSDDVWKINSGSLRARVRSHDKTPFSIGVPFPPHRAPAEHNFNSTRCVLMMMIVVVVVVVASPSKDSAERMNWIIRNSVKLNFPQCRRGAHTFTYSHKLDLSHFDYSYYIYI